MKNIPSMPLNQQLKETVLCGSDSFPIQYYVDNFPAHIQNSRKLTGGAEDYIVKPFEMLELLVRIEKVLSRFGKAEEVLELDGVTLDMQKRRVIRGGEILSLTPIEYDLLCSLARNKNIALSREKLLHEIWGFDFEGETRTVDVHVASLRKKTGVRIVAVPKVGYRLEVGE